MSEKFGHLTGFGKTCVAGLAICTGAGAVVLYRFLNKRYKTRRLKKR